MKDRKQFLPISKQDMAERGWDACDIILVTGDAYVDHPSYGAAMIGRVLEDAGYKVGIIAQPNWKTSEDFLALGRREDDALEQAVLRLERSEVDDGLREDERAVRPVCVPFLLNGLGLLFGELDVERVHNQSLGNS